MPLRQVMVARIATVLLWGALAAPSLAWAQAPADAELEALRRQVLGRFEVMPLREGIALVGRDRSRRVEIVDGLVLDAGTPLSGAELRERLGADAGPVLRLSYLDNAALRRLFAPPSAAAPPPAPRRPSRPLLPHLARRAHATRHRPRRARQSPRHRPRRRRHRPHRPAPSAAPAYGWRSASR